jgi:hypothetical protein
MKIEQIVNNVINSFKDYLNQPNIYILENNPIENQLDEHTLNAVFRSIAFSHKINIDSKFFLIALHKSFDKRGNGQLDTIVLSEYGISFVIDKFKNDRNTNIHNLSYGWEDIDSVTMDDNTFYIDSYLESIEDGDVLDFQDNFETAELNIMSVVLNNIILEIKNTTKQQLSTIQDLIADDKYTEALSLIQEYEKNYEFSHRILYNKIESLIYLKEYIKAELIIEEYIEFYKDSKSLLNDIISLKTFLLLEKGKYYEALKCINNMSPSKKIGEQIDIVDMKNVAYEEYIENFSNISYEERKLVLIDNELTDLSSNKFIVLKRDTLPNINFPIGHPCEKSLYIGHPYTAQSYIPLQNYEFELLLDKINEYSYVLQCMGATKLSIENITGQNKDTQNNSSLNIDANLDSTINGGGASVDIKKHNNITQNFNQKICRNQTFAPTKRPYLPDNLVWYPQLATWQRLFEQRANGNILEHQDIISTQQTKLVSQNELLNIKADFKAATIKGNASINYETESLFDEKETSDWKISVEFAPIGTLLENSSLKDIKNDETEKIIITNSNHDKYKDEVEFMLEDDGQIDDDERRILERKRKKLGLTEEEAIKIENALNTTVNFSSAEIEFMEELKESAEDNLLDDGDWRILLRRANKLGISEERAKELCNIAFKTVVSEYSEAELSYIEEIKFCLEDDDEISAKERRMLNRERDNLGISEERAEEIEQEFIKEIKKV